MKGGIMPRKSKAEMLEDLRNKLAAAEVEAQQAEAKEATTLVSEIKALETRIAELDKGRTEAHAKVDETFDARTAKVEARLAIKQDKLAKLATPQLTFTSVEVEEV